MPVNLLNWPIGHACIFDPLKPLCLVFFSLLLYLSLPPFSPPLLNFSFSFCPHSSCSPVHTWVHNLVHLRIHTCSTTMLRGSQLANHASTEKANYLLNVHGGREDYSFSQSRGVVRVCTCVCECVCVVLRGGAVCVVSLTISESLLDLVCLIASWHFCPKQA